MLGVRVKLRQQGRGALERVERGPQHLWSYDAQIVELIDALREHELLDCLHLLHYHLGSQIPNIRDIRDGVLEACRYYVSLKQEGATMGYLDLGGGLGVDYDGSQTNSNYSKNYFARRVLHPMCRDHHGHARPGGHRAPGDHHRVGPRDGGLFLDPAFQHPRRHQLRAGGGRAGCARDEHELATVARPDSVMITGCAMPAGPSVPMMVSTTSVQYSSSE